jgi:amidase
MRAALMRHEARARMAALLDGETVLCLPTTPFPAPLKGQSVSALAYPRDRISCLTCVGGLVGVPQVNLPGATVGGAPVGLSIIGAPGQDLSLLALARRWEARAE